MSKYQKLLTKSKYMIGLQCNRSLWIMCNDKDSLPDIDLSTQHRFDEGHIVGELAKQLYPTGIDIPESDFTKSLELSQELLSKRVPLFEAGFIFDNCYGRADILVPVGKDEWDVVEVKSSTAVKKEYLHDLSFQVHCYKGFGLKIRKTYLLHINNQYVKKGKINPKKFFVKEDITAEVYNTIDGINKRISVFQDLINNDVYDTSKYGEHCESPKKCPMPKLDWGFLPKTSVFSLYRGGKKSIGLYESNIIEIKDIPADYKLTEKQQIQVKCETGNCLHIELDNIKKELDRLVYPLYYIDFETYNPAVPLYDKLKPYQRIPFQFSLHIQETPNGKLKHIEFLAETKDDPRADFIKHIKDNVGDTGSIVVYNEGFEKGVMREVAEVLPEYKDWVAGLVPRYVDLLLVFRNFYYYNPKQLGSCSIKKVLPALIPEKSYDNMDIGNGMDASLQYGYSIHKYTDQEQIKDIRKHLLKYCCQDTLSMYDIVEHLRKIIKK